MANENIPLKIGIIGCGKVVERHHLPALRTIQSVEVAAAAEIDPERLHRIADKFGIKNRYLDYRELLDDPAIEAVAVCTNLQHHYEPALAALEAGKHLLIEKPLTMTLDEADRLIEKAAGSDQKILVGFNKRWHRLVRRGREMIRRGELGPVGMVNMMFCTGHYNRYIPKWRLKREEGGGSIIENSSHFYDLCRFLLDSEFQEITAISHATEACDDEPAVVTGKTKDGVLLNCVLSDFLPDQNVIEVMGRECTIRLFLHKFDGLERIPLYSYEGDLKSRLRKVTTLIKELPQAYRQGRYGGDYNASFRDQWLHFIDCVRNDTAVECTLEDGRAALKAALAAIESTSTKKTIIL